MITLHENGVYLVDGKVVKSHETPAAEAPAAETVSPAESF